MECECTGTSVSAVNRISVEQLATAINKVRSMDLAGKVALVDEVFAKQPNLLASCLVQSRLGVAAESVEFLLNILLVCFQAMQESSHHWPLISEDTQARQMERHVGAVHFSEDINDPALADVARKQYLASHPEPQLLAYVLDECTLWLQDLAHRRIEAESDKFVMMAAVNIVNCIAYPDA